MGDHYCIVCNDFKSSIVPEMERHVAIVHSQGTFSTLQCQICHRQFYDFDHFQDHVRESPMCFTDCFKVTNNPLNPNLQKAFSSLVSQMMKPLSDRITGASIRESTVQIKKVKQEISENSPKIISVISLANRGQDANPTQTNLLIEQTKTIEVIKVGTSNGAMIKRELSDQSRQSSDVLLDSFLEPETPETGEVSDQASTPEARRSVEKYCAKTVKQKRKRRDIKCNDLRRHCLLIVNKRRYNGRMTCRVCNCSLSAAYDGSAITNVLNHARLHFGVKAFLCDLCGYKGISLPSIQSHLSKRHAGAASQQYTNTTSNYVENLKEWFTKCFDHEIRSEVHAKRSRRKVVCTGERLASQESYAASSATK